jgi:hypothetical protein
MVGFYILNIWGAVLGEAIDVTVRYLTRGDVRADFICPLKVVLD